ncbi:adenylate kinase [Ornithinimicrobium panacihumi]|uniref:adenylate kinase n=1 Tax=Ornithinimicrobium panacihumi TaxID=2008449 RepID=UPI003F88C5B3
MPAATAEDVLRADRVLLYGVTGSGKSTAAVLLGVALGLPSHLVDEEVGWLPGWVERPLQEQRQIAEGIVAGERWVLDSAYGKWADLVLPRAQVMVALDYPRRLSLARLLRRTGTRWITRQPICNGNVESARQVLSRDSIILWHFRSYRRKTERIRVWESAPSGLPVLRLTHPRQLEALLAEVVAAQT